MRYLTGALGLATVTLLFTNYRALVLVGKQEQENELLKVQNQTYNWMIMQLGQPDLDVPAYIQEMKEKLEFIEQIAGTPPEPKEFLQ